MTIAYGVLVTAVIVLAAMVYLPMNAKTGRSLIFFDDIAAMEWGDFQSAARNMSHDLIERQLLHQIYVVARVASVKDAAGTLGDHHKFAGNRRMVRAVGVEQHVIELVQREAGYATAAFLGIPSSVRQNRRAGVTSSGQ